MENTKLWAVFLSLMLLQQCLARPPDVDLRSRALHGRRQTSSSLSSPSAAVTSAAEGRDFVESALEIGSIVLPLLLQFMSGSSSSSAGDIEKIGAGGDLEDPFSWSNLLSIGLKLFLTFVSNAENGIDKSDTFPTQAILGTLISAVTGSKNPTEVSKMAKQATEVLSLVQSLFEALFTSVSGQ